MPKVTSDEFVEKWGRKLKASTDDIRRGVEKVTESPTAKAASKSDKWLARVSADETKRRFEAGLKSVSLEDWKSKMINKGVGRVAAGVDGAKDKVRTFADKLLPHIDSALAKIKDMPDLTLDDSINRMTTFIREMSKLKVK